MPKLTHIDTTGAARMVDVGGKALTKRQASAKGTLTMAKSTLKAILEGNMPKGDVIGTARLAGIMAAKKTSDLIPLCHPLALSSIDVDIVAIDSQTLEITATASLTGQTGVEMEALTAVSVAGLTLYDMAKAIDKSMSIGNIRLVSKTGGKSGDYTAS